MEYEYELIDPLLHEVLDRIGFNGDEIISETGFINGYNLLIPDTGYFKAEDDPSYDIPLKMAETRDEKVRAMSCLMSVRLVKLDTASVKIEKLLEKHPGLR